MFSHKVSSAPLKVFVNQSSPCSCSSIRIRIITLVSLNHILKIIDRVMLERESVRALSSVYPAPSSLCHQLLQFLGCWVDPWYPTSASIIWTSSILIELRVAIATGSGCVIGEIIVIILEIQRLGVVEMIHTMGIPNWSFFSRRRATIVVTKD